MTTIIQVSVVEMILIFQSSNEIENVEQLTQKLLFVTSISFLSIVQLVQLHV